MKTTSEYTQLLCHRLLATMSLDHKFLAVRMMVARLLVQTDVYGSNDASKSSSSYWRTNPGYTKYLGMSAEDLQKKWVSTFWLDIYSKSMMMHKEDVEHLVNKLTLDKLSSFELVQRKKKVVINTAINQEKQYTVERVGKFVCQSDAKKEAQKKISAAIKLEEEAEAMLQAAKEIQAKAEKLYREAPLLIKAAEKKAAVRKAKAYKD